MEFYLKKENFNIIIIFFFFDNIFVCLFHGSLCWIIIKLQIKIMFIFSKIKYKYKNVTTSNKNIWKNLGYLKLELPLKKETRKIFSYL